MKYILFCILILVINLVGCGTTPEVIHRETISGDGTSINTGLEKGEEGPSRKLKKSEIVGKATWYGKKHHGRTTANGEKFDMYAFTAAHKTLPFNTVVRVTNVKNRKNVIVRVNDRGPYGKGRIIDLSHAAAKDLDMIRAGVISVEIEVLRWGDNQRYHKKKKKKKK